LYLVLFFVAHDATAEWQEAIIICEEEIVIAKIYSDDGPSPEIHIRIFHGHRGEK
jgi:hypothetical protein